MKHLLPIVHVPEAALQARLPERASTRTATQRLDLRIARLRDVLGLTTWCVGTVALPPVCSAWPLPKHRVNDKMLVVLVVLVVLDGRADSWLGTFRHPDARRKPDLSCSDRSCASRRLHTAKLLAGWFQMSGRTVQLFVALSLAPKV